MTHRAAGPSLSNMWRRRAIASALAVLLAECGAVAAARPVHGRTPPAAAVPATQPVPGDPPAVAVAVPGRSGLTTTLELRSPSDWRLLARLGSFGQSFTDNGLALAADGRTAYFTLIPRSRRVQDLLIERATPGGGRPQRVAYGEQPAVSPDGRSLAYLKGAPRRPAIAVRDLSRTGRVRSVEVGRLLGRHADLFNSSTTTWLGGNEVAALAGPVLIAARRASAALPRRPPRQSAVLLLVSVPPAAPLAVRAITLPGIDPSAAVLAADAAAPGSLLLAALGPRDAARIYRVDPTAPAPQPVLSIPAAQVLAFDPAGQRVLYIQGHNPPALYLASLAGGRLVDRHRLRRSYADDKVAW